MDLSSSKELRILQVLPPFLPNGLHSSEPALAKKLFRLALGLLKLPAECSLPVWVLTLCSGMWLPETQQKWEWGPRGFGTALVNITFPVQHSIGQGEAIENQKNYSCSPWSHQPEFWSIFKWVLSENLKNSILFVLSIRCYCNIPVSYQVLPNYFWESPRGILMGL